MSRTPSGHRKRVGYYSNAQLRFRYGITVTERDEIIVAQGGDCPLCLWPLTQPLPGSRREFPPNPVVDHNPEIAEKRKSVRGVLHTRCNVMLAYLEKFPWLISDHVRKYLDDPPAQRVLA